MWTREKIIRVLDQAKSVDAKFEKFGASKHRYRLNPPIRASFVRGVEERYGFVLPEDYFRFITEIGDGGAGPDYGIMPFVELLEKGSSPQAETYQEEYRKSLANPFLPRPMGVDEVEEYAIATRETYELAPDKYYIYEKEDPDALCIMDGFYILGTHGCQWDFGLVLSGEKRGQVFDTDNEGAYSFTAGSFEEFYQNWLMDISDTEKLKRELEERRELWRKMRTITG